MSDRYVVVGNPVAHSRSPLIHTRFALANGQDMEYRRLLVPRDGFEQAATRFFADGGKGMNVTVPFKLDAFRFAQRPSARAARAGAVNTLWIAEGRVHGDNTDGPGLVRDLVDNHGWTLQGARLLLLGAGGAVRGVLAPLLACGPAAVTIVNRNAERACELAASFADAGKVTGCGYDALALAGSGSFDLVINGTSASLQQEVPPVPDAVLVGAACYDMAYADRPTAFLAAAAAAGARACADGLGMLVEQAAEAFLLWRGIRPATARLIRDLRRGVLIRAAHGSDDSRALAGLLHEYRQCIGVEPGAPRAGVERLPPSSPGDFAAPGEIALLALCGEEAAGCVSVLALGEGACEMRQLWVRPAYRGGGTGRALASAAITAARAAGWRTMRFVLQAGQHEAATLLPTLDFRPRASYHEGALAPRLLWELELGVASMKEESR